MKQENTVKKAENKQQATAEDMIVVVRVRGTVRLLTTVKDTLDMLRLYKKNYCVLLPATKPNIGMIQKAKDYVTWGPAPASLVAALYEKRGKLYTGPLTDTKKKIEYKSRYVEFNGKKYTKFFALNPPRGGYGRKGIKTHFSHGGAVGERGNKIGELVESML